MILEHADGEPILTLNPDQIWGLLERGRFGRLVVVVGQRADIFPINYAAAPDRTLVFRTAPGTKLAKLAINETVLFEADHISVDTAWSVTVRGQAQWLQRTEEIEEAERLELRPWAPSVKDNYVRVTPTEISGRHFQFGPHPERELGEGSEAG
ncbi:pyridoxamine 5'-phosphate oxidase family protein [Nesterenkonia sp. LB17]|uniref:pyridoxamine 5'-phosphate oxidase family protein n=1 Tax=unclassified Nesterenkonia TaxID=2629769 RepID=UPI001F4C6C48|nr:MULTISPECIES: pyridoxamine 5'-phosphate oxidase family protein [unclassified Nesterenkonia]MCH8559127.1 pyridoxamine 5'-phosphate oxidase family protein [Nesterenkonia sp. DZ6]MCH8563041.1 pyridoxamine 5'-phosphate oxidase family protein [Nesterenkonia sp. YGD6]MCH8565143.1 pyridoxamine 5'-phosphate oxidase family protein [Nesterenkonia sp. LB17]MCH8571462.1 pyridoxamine 5'-phosphate oxidase family protein [Nesterenkonia sp. AY15]